MKQKFKEITFETDAASKSQFDIVPYEDILEKSPEDHNQFEFHKVSFYAILIYTHSKGTYNLNFKDYNFKKGTVFTVRKNNIHKFYKNDAKGILLIFTENFILNHLNQSEASTIYLLFNEILSSPILQLNAQVYEEIMTLVQIIKNEHFKVNDNHSILIVRNLVQSILSKLIRIKASGNALFENNRYLSSFLEFQNLVENECFKTRKVSYYSDKMNLTSKTLSNVTQSTIHKSPKSFITDVFIIQIKRLIINSPLTLTEIAYQVGFDEPTNFFKYFKKYVGVSASDFRQTR